MLVVPVGGLLVTWGVAGRSATAWTGGEGEQAAEPTEQPVKVFDPVADLVINPRQPNGAPRTGNRLADAIAGSMLYDDPIFVEPTAGERLTLIYRMVLLYNHRGMYENLSRLPRTPTLYAACSGLKNGRHLYRLKSQSRSRFQTPTSYAIGSKRSTHTSESK